jgi:hypothetical protein
LSNNDGEKRECYRDEVTICISHGDSRV